MVRTIASVIVFSFAAIFIFQRGSAQDFSLGIKVGGMAYNGELNEGTIASTIRIVNPSFGFTINYEPVYPLLIELSGMRGKISGDDGFSSREWMNKRNLSFESLLLDLSLSAKWLLFRQFNIPSKFDVYPMIGASLFYYNPKTFYKGEWYELRKLGTEGQGNPGFGEKYSPIAYSLRGGGGIEYQLNDVITFGLDLIIGWTSTDYLDDVSGFYVNYDELLELNGPLAAALSNRTGEYLNTAPVRVSTGTRRGNPGDQDYIASGAFYFRYNISYIQRRTGKACPAF